VQGFPKLASRRRFIGGVEVEEDAPDLMAMMLRARQKHLIERQQQQQQQEKVRASTLPTATPLSVPAVHDAPMPGVTRVARTINKLLDTYVPHMTSSHMVGAVT
jgi:hypothetical protein